MLLVAIAAWFVGWRSWDWDERLLLGCWFIAVSVSILRSRMHVQRGIWRAALAGGLAAAFAYAMYFGLSMADLIFSRAADDYFLPNVLAAMIVGTIAGAGLAAAFTPSGLEELPPSQRSDRLRHRMTSSSSVRRR